MSDPTRPKAALFDVDGTLVDTNDLHTAAWDEAFRRFGYAFDRDALHFQVGKGGDNYVPSLVPDIGGEEQNALEAYRGDLYKTRYLPRAVPFPGVRGLFERLYADGVKIVLASSSHQEEVDFYLNLTGAADLVSSTTSKEDVEHSKPCGDIFAAALKKAGVAAEEAVVIGDTPWDIEAASKSGLRALAFRSGGFSDEDLAGAAALYDGPADLLARYDSSLFAGR